MANDDFFYYEAARIVSAIVQRKGRLKSLCFASRHRNKPGLVALVMAVCSEIDLLRQVVERAELFRKERHLDEYLTLVLLYDFLKGRRQKCSEKLLFPILRNKTRLKAEHVQLLIKSGGKKNEQPILVSRYVRVNTLLCSVEECIGELHQLGFEMVDVKPVGKQFKKDEHLPDVLVFPPLTNLINTKLYHLGKIILQDKSSCFSVAVLAPPPAVQAFDVCAAPGNKTTQLAAAVGPQGKVWAFERDNKRVSILREMVEKHASHLDLVTVVCADFLSIDPLLYSKVEYCVVDPSCSGSGIIDAGQRSSREIISAERLDSLAKFQISIIRHAMKLPALKRLVYSTCSVHEEENELVVQQILQLEPSFTLVSRPLATWPRRGMDKYDFAQDVIRVDPELDFMTGFFVACFQRVP